MPEKKKVPSGKHERIKTKTNKTTMDLHTKTGKVLKVSAVRTSPAKQESGQSKGSVKASERKKRKVK